MFQTGNLGELVSLEHGRDRVALVDLSIEDSAREFTAGEINSAANHVAHKLVSLGLEPGCSVGVLSENCAEYIVCSLGILRARMVFVPINQRQSSEIVNFIIADGDLKAMFVSDLYAELCPDGVERLSMTGPFWTGANVWSENIRPEADQLARIIYTSGSTGRPKGVELSHSSQIAVLKSYLDTDIPLFQAKAVAVAAPLFHMNALVFSELTLAAGGVLVLHRRFKSRQFLEAIDTYKIQCITGVPTMLAKLAMEKDLIDSLDLSSVELIFVGSAPLSDYVLNQTQSLFPNAEILNGYGTTETGGAIFGAHPQGLPRPQLSLGHPIPRCQVRLDNENDDGQGVLEVKGPGNMLGYRNLPDLTAKRLKDGWFNTGDVMRRDEHGFYFFVGREDDMFVCGGENIYPGEVEKLLERCDAVREACVLGVAEPVRGMIPVAFIVKDKMNALSEEDLKSFSINNGPAYMHPRHIWFVDALPLASTGKIDRKKLLHKSQLILGIE